MASIADSVLADSTEGIRPIAIQKIAVIIAGDTEEGRANARLIVDAVNSYRK